MKLSFLSIKSGNLSWSDEALREYKKKISGFIQFEIEELKSKAAARENSSNKAHDEGHQLLKRVNPNDFIVAFDERGRTFKDSVAFSGQIQKALESGKPRIVFIIGGAYGLSDEIRERADLVISLSGLTMNHHVARTVALEQIYRALTIQKGIPYHN